MSRDAGRLSRVAGKLSRVAGKLLQKLCSKYRILHGKCARTVFTQELWRIENRTSEPSEQVRFLIQNNKCVNTVKNTFYAMLCLLYTY